MKGLTARIDAGYCIQNPGPNDQGYCDCYKYPVPYTLFGHDGVIMLCRGWVDYVMAYGDYLGRVDIVRDKIKELLISKYPLAALPDCYISRWGHISNGTTLSGITLNISPKPFDLRVGFMPSFYLKHLHDYDIVGMRYYAPVYDDIPMALRNKLAKTMDVIKESNKRALSNYYKVHNHKLIAKKHHAIMSELLTKIKQYETA